MNVVPASAVELPAAPEAVAAGSRSRDATVRRAFATADVAAVAIAFLLVLAPGEQWRATAWGMLSVAAWPLLLGAYGLYEPEARRFTRGFVRDLPRVAHAALVGAVLFWLYAVVTPVAAPAVGTLLLFALAAGAAILAVRGSVRAALRRRLAPERAAIIGDAASVASLARKLRTHPEYGVELVGVLGGGGAAAAGDLPAMADLADRDDVDRLIVAGPAAVDGGLGELVRGAHRLGLTVDYVPYPLEALGGAAELDAIEGVAVHSLHPPQLSRCSRGLKRAVDIAGACVLLAVAAPLMALIAVAVKLDSSGPVVFRQQRIGRGGRRLRITKFRTMVVGAESLTGELRRLSRDPNWLLIDGDPRLTRVGRRLRARSLDELPQLWSVLKGDMSLVGPRPLVEHEDRLITGWARGRLDLKPGLTGLWQVLGRTCIPFEEMVKLDYIYVTNWSARGDLQLLLRTLGVVLSGRGAN